MLKLYRKLSGSEGGQALPIVLALLAIGGLTIVVNLNYATTSLNGTKDIREDMRGLYAASSGVENTLWSLARSVTPQTPLPQTVNQMSVDIQTDNLGTFTLYFGEMIDVSGVHVDWLDVQGTMTATNVTGRYQYDITVTWQAPQGKIIKLIEVGARIPLGYAYVGGSASSFPGNMSTSDPSSITTDSVGAYIIKWTWNPGQGPLVRETDPVETQSFYIEGTGSVSGAYSCVISQDNDVGTVSEITGTRYRITSTATRPQDGKTTTRVTSEAIVRSDATINILSWQITK